MIALHRMRGSVVAIGAVLCAACAGGGGLQLADITPASIPTLEAQRAATPGNAQVLTQLGVAYFKAQRYADARPPLDTATQLDPQSGIAAIYLGMTAEALGDFPAARDAYTHYIAVSRSRDLRNTARQRLELIDRRQLEYQARQALANESTLTTQAPEANTVAVMPFVYTGTNDDIKPLSRGLAQLLVTDLGRARGIKVLERERMQAMLDEMHLAQSGNVDPQTAVRSGHLLRAERVVQGSLADQGGQLRVDATVVTVNNAAVVTPPSQTDQLAQLFDLEKRLAFGIFDRLGVTLTAGDSAAIAQRPTANLQAFLAYSRGLTAQDNGDFEEARNDFIQASQLDPNFGEAKQGSQAAGDLSVASGQTVTQVEVTVIQQSNLEGQGPGEGNQQTSVNNTTDGINGSTGGTLDNQTNTGGTTGALTPNQNKTADVTGTDTPKSTTGTVTITIKRP